MVGVVPTNSIALNSPTVASAEALAGEAGGRMVERKLPAISLPTYRPA